MPTPKATEAVSTPAAIPPTATPAVIWPESLGIAPVDAALTAIRDGDAAALLELVQVASSPCTTDVGDGGPPKCPSGVTDGTVIRYFPYFECDGWGTSDAAINRLIDPSTYPIAVLKWEPSIPSQFTGTQVTHAVLLARGTFTGDGRLLTTLSFDDKSLREISSDCNAYSQAAFASGYLPDIANGADVQWRVYPASSTPAPSPSPTSGATRPGADTAPQGTQSGDPDIDRIITAVLAGDVDTLVASVELTETACSRLLGVGVPPNCEGAPGSPPDGSLVKVFPMSACEGEWTYDVGDAMERLLSNQPQLFAVIRVDTPIPVQGIPGFPLQDHLILLESTLPSPPRAGIVLGVGKGHILTITTPCHRDPPEALLGPSGPYQVILRGPAYR